MRKRAQPIGNDEEESLWQLGLLGDHSAQALVNAMVFQMGLFFALRSGQEHRRRIKKISLKLTKSGIKHMKRPLELALFANLHFLLVYITPNILAANFMDC